MSVDGQRVIIEDRYLHYLYEGIVALNEPLLNDPLLAEAFDFAVADAALLDGRLDPILADLDAM